jgi:hypothetical protein
MGTRNLTCVFHDGKYKVAQYCQWDGYPSGQGVKVLEFLRKFKRDQFVKQLERCRFIDQQEYDKLIAKLGVKSADGWISADDSKRIQKKYPQLHRDMGGDVLDFIKKAKGNVALVDSLSFAGDSLFCEWCYVVDLDKDTLEVYGGFNKNVTLPKTERFAHLAYIGGGEKKPQEYAPVKLLKSYKLSDLPTGVEFVQELDPKPPKE